MENKNLFNDARQMAKEILARIEKRSAELIAEISKRKAV